MTRVGLWLWVVPRNVLIGVVIGYRKVISPLYGDVCRYYPSCSSYGLQQLQQQPHIVTTFLQQPQQWQQWQCQQSQGG